MRVCLDTEYDARYTDRGVARLACMSYAINDGPAQLVGYLAAVKLFVKWARDPSVTFTTHSGYNDFAVLADEAHLVFEGELVEHPGLGPYWELVHALYEQRRVYDTEIAQRLTHTRLGMGDRSAELGVLAKTWLGVDVSTEKKIPKQARELLDAATPYAEWPQDLLDATPHRVKFGLYREQFGADVSRFPGSAQDYALEDARLPVELRCIQAQRWRKLTRDGKIPNLDDQILSSWMLHMVALPGWIADRERAQRIRDIYRKTIADCERTLFDARLIELTPEKLVQKSDKLKSLVFSALGEDTPLTKTGAATVKERGEEPTDDDRREFAATDAATAAKCVTKLGGPKLGTTPKKSTESVEHALQALSLDGVELSESWAPLWAHWMRGRTSGLLKKGDSRAAVLALHNACTNKLKDVGVLEREPEKITVKSKRVAERVYLLLGDEAKMTDKGYELFGEAPTDDQRLEYCAKDAKAIRAAILSAGATPRNIADAVEKSEQGPDAFDRWLDESKEGTLNALAVRSKADKTIVNFLDKLDTPRRVRTAYKTLVDTGRTSARSINIQQLPRDYDKPKHLHVRGCIVPDPGWCFVIADYSQLELCALAHILTKLVRHYAKTAKRRKIAERILGYSISEDYVSTLAQAINNDQDCHVRMASVLRSETYATCIEIYKSADAKKDRGEPLTAIEKKMVEDRQMSKPCNFGFPGGLGALAFVDYAAGYGVSITPEIAVMAKAAYMAAWPEMKLYFWHIKKAIKTREAEGYFGGLCKQIGSGRLRGDCTFTQWANGWFQGLAADGAKYAGWLLVDAAYRRPESPMYGTRPSGFVHDEYLTNAPIELAKRALPEQERLMIEGMRRFIPDVTIKAPGKILTERWAK